MTVLSCNVIAMGFSFQPLTPPFPYCVATAWYHMGLLSAKSLHPETIQTWEGQGWPRRAPPVTGKKCEAPLSVKNKKNLLWREESPVFLLPEGNAPRLDSRLQGRCVLVMKDSAQRGISRHRFRMSISGVWNRSGCHSWVTPGLCWESLENGDAVDIRARLFVKHSPSQIVSPSKNPIYCRIV